MLQGVKDKINEQVPDYLECKAKICELSDVCLLDEITENEIELFIEDHRDELEEEIYNRDNSNVLGDTNQRRILWPVIKSSN